MKCLLIYDIPDDRIRTKIATFCLDYGLDRVQYSAFMGELSANHQEELMLKLGRRLGKAAGKIDLFPICRQDWRSRISITQQMDDPEVKQEANAGDKL
ncbi:MAG: CRISPR-associated endonuclease Cas2 [Caldilineaceae bacterium]|nr:CRISPR-associated endonuclease Cas2 [Caldilineaceae bacterium]